MILFQRMLLRIGKKIGCSLFGAYFALRLCGSVLALSWIICDSYYGCYMCAKRLYVVWRHILDQQVKPEEQVKENCLEEVWY